MPDRPGQTQRHQRRSVTPRRNRQPRDALHPCHGTRTHQPLTLARAAADELLSCLGFTDIQRDADATVTACDPDTTPGLILTRGADLYGRCVAFVGRGPAPRTPHPTRPTPRSSSTWMLLRTNVNHHQLGTGLAYPTYYRNLFPVLRNEFTTTVTAAQAAQRGVWAGDATTTGAAVTTATSLTDDVVILPKLFRSLADYLQLGGGDLSLVGLTAFLAQARDRFFILSTRTLDHRPRCHRRGHRRHSAPHPLPRPTSCSTKSDPGEHPLLAPMGSYRTGCLPASRDIRICPRRHHARSGARRGASPRRAPTRAAAA